MDQPLEPRDRATPPRADMPDRMPIHPAPDAIPPPPVPGEPARPRGRRRRWWPWLILVLAIGVIGYALLRPRVQHAPAGRHRRDAGSGQAAAAQPVTEAVAHIGDMPVVLTQLGTVTSLATITVQSQITGYLLEVNFHEGQEVHKGEQLALVDPRLYIATLTQDEGNLRSATPPRCTRRRPTSPATSCCSARRASPRRPPRTRSTWSARPRARCCWTRARSPVPSRTSPTATSSRRSTAAWACARSMPATTSPRPPPTDWWW